MSLDNVLRNLELFIYIFLLTTLSYKGREITETTVPNNGHSETNATKFVIFTAQRTGSTYLCELLSKHPSILMNYEIFNDKNDSYRRIIYEHEMSPSILSKRIEHPEPFLEKIWYLTGNRTAVGFKIFFFHIHESEVERLLLQNKSIKKIILIRADLLGVYFLGVPYFDSNQLMNGTTFFKQASTSIDKRISNWNKLPENIRKYANVNMSMDELMSCRPLHFCTISHFCHLVIEELSPPYCWLKCPLLVIKCLVYLLEISYIQRMKHNEHNYG
eukprot:gene2636-5172_t